MKNKKDFKNNKRVYNYIGYVVFKDSTKKYTFGAYQNYKANDKVVVETIRGLEVGTLAEELVNFEDFVSNGLEIKPIIRKATPIDLENIAKNLLYAKEAIKLCQSKINKLGLDMNLIDAEYTLDRSKVIFVYVADERVDFRDLLKELASEFKCRIELRQIGPRNKAKMVGGLGCCGMETCCSRFLNNFDIVSINMAKNQMLALNIAKLSGQCGKLMCCLKYEDQYYTELKKESPKINSYVEYEGATYKVAGLNLLINQVKLENKEQVHFLNFDQVWPNKDYGNNEETK